MFKRVFYLIIITLLLIGLVGCSNSGSVNTDNNDDDVIDKVHVSFKSNAFTNTASALKAMVQEEELVQIDQSLYAEPYNNNLQGNLVNSFTPNRFVVGLSRMEVYDREYGRKPVMPDVGVQYAEGSGFSIIPVLDMVYAKNFIESSYLHEYGNLRYEGIELLIWAETMLDGGTYHDSFPIISEIHVDLGEEYSGISFENEKSNPVMEVDNRNIHVFELKDIIPFKDNDNSTMEVYIIFDESIDNRMILNPNGDYLDFYNPYFFEQDWTRINNDGYAMYYPTQTLDFSGGNKELTFEWDLTNLIEVYDNRTPDDKTDDLVTLNLSNPFPLTFKMEAYSDSFDTSIETIREVSQLQIRHYNFVENQNILRWINPAQVSFKQVHITRKEDSPPTNINDGLNLYTGSFPVFVDTNNVQSGRNYYYKLFVEDQNGNITSGKVIDIET